MANVDNPSEVAGKEVKLTQPGDEAALRVRNRIRLGTRNGASETE